MGWECSLVCPMRGGGLRLWVRRQWGWDRLTGDQKGFGTAGSVTALAAEMRRRRSMGVSMEVLTI